MKRVKFSGNQADFLLLLNPKGDQFEPTPEINWEAPVVENAPSGFGFQVTTKTENAIVTLVDVIIDLVD